MKDKFCRLLCVHSLSLFIINGCYTLSQFIVNGGVAFLQRPAEKLRPSSVEDLLWDPTAGSVTCLQRRCRVFTA